MLKLKKTNLNVFELICLIVAPELKEVLPFGAIIKFIKIDEGSHLAIREEDENTKNIKAVR